jgi:hypothetical protein
MTVSVTMSGVVVLGMIVSRVVMRCMIVSLTRRQDGLTRVVQVAADEKTTNDYLVAHIHISSKYGIRKHKWDFKQVPAYR